MIKLHVPLYGLGDAPDAAFLGENFENHWKNLVVLQNLYYLAIVHLSSDHLVKVWLIYLHFLGSKAELNLTFYHEL